jgi:hypothetical protein
MMGDDEVGNDEGKLKDQGEACMQNIIIEACALSSMKFKVHIIAKIKLARAALYIGIINRVGSSIINCPHY